MFLKITQNSQENNYTGVTFIIKLQVSSRQKETPAHVFPYEFCDIFKNTNFVEHLRVAASRKTLKQKDVADNKVLLIEEIERFR